MSTVVIPVIINKEPARCPSCNNVENIKQVCASCGHEYKYAPARWYENLAIILIILSVMWIIITLISWIMPNYGQEPQTLVQVIAEQWTWLKALSNRIY